MSTATHNAKVNGERHDMDLVKLVEEFGSGDGECRAYLEALRWPEGVRCPACGFDKVSHISTRRQLDCNSCRTRFSVTAGTTFEGSHLPLWKWFLATYLMVESKKGMSANQLKRTLHVSYKTAWYLCHRIRYAMGEVAREPLSGTVEADETYVGGKASGFASKQEAAVHRLDNKTTILGAIERGGEVRFRVAPDSKRPNIHRFLNDVVAEKAEAIYTDSHRAYRGIGDENTRHEWVDHSTEEWVRGEVHTNTVEGVWSLFNRSLIGSYHKMSAKHMPAYLDEFAFRFNGRHNPYLFRDTLLALINGPRLTYENLVDKGGG